MSVQQPPDDKTALRSPEETPTVIVGDRQASALQLVPGTILGGRYRIVSLIGLGGMGNVYRADDLKLGQTVALKFLSRSSEAQRIYEEVRIGRQISHPNVCRLYDIADIEGHLFITMEYIDGEDLASLLRRIGALPRNKAVQIAREIAAGLAAAHEKGVVHRDLKPANVMIDGTGRARVTDFGLAIAGGSASDGAGTPAYMAPEQIERGEATFKSDVYSLGLILYEVFKGKRLFESKSIGELIDIRQRTDPQSISRELREIDADIQRVIIRCLEYEPAARPDAPSIIASLPGGDRLQAAVDAGETPSPEMVAAAEQPGELPAKYAAPLLAVVALGVVGLVMLMRQTMLYNLVPLPKPPAALVERAKDLIEKFGHGGTAADHAYIFAPRMEVLSAIAAEDRSPHRWRKLQSPDAPAIVFQYRENSKPLVPLALAVPVTDDDPPFTEQGMVDVTLDPKGRLIGFRAVPPRVQQPQRRKPVDWSLFVSETGVDPRSLQQTYPLRAAPVDTDAKFAWTGRRGQQSVRIEAASYQGEPVWFTVMSVGEATVTVAQTGSRAFMTAPSGPLIGLSVVGFLSVGALIARRNVRRGRGDRKGALRTAAAVFVCGLLAVVFRDAAPMTRLPQLVSFALFNAIEAWLFYLALEPYVRRRWPRLLIGWARLLSGQWRDPMVGRDLLIGAAAGAVWVVLRHVMLVAPSWFGQAPFIPLHSYLSAISDSRNAIFLFFFALFIAIFASLGGFLTLLLLRILFRSDWIALATLLLIGTAVGVLSGENLPVEIFVSFLCALIVVVVFWRFGLLALVAAGFVALSLMYAPLTLDPSSWYFGRSLLFLVTVGGTALFGFFTSLGEKRWLSEVAVD